MQFPGALKTSFWEHLLQGAKPAIRFQDLDKKQSNISHFHAIWIDVLHKVLPNKTWQIEHKSSNA